LQACLDDADVKYKQTWASICGQLGASDGSCAEFIGSPKDLEFSQLRNQEKTLCATLYK
jgi:hypothetical protein